jgi:hypothetical protein
MGTWKTYEGTGKLSGIKGGGTFKVTAEDRNNEFIMEMGENMRPGDLVTIAF